MSKMRACFADNSILPMICVNDDDRPFDCTYANKGIKKECCEFWQPKRAIKLALNILGVEA